MVTINSHIVVQRVTVGRTNTLAKAEGRVWRGQKAWLARADDKGLARVEGRGHGWQGQRAGSGKGPVHAELSGAPPGSSGGQCSQAGGASP